MRRRGSWDIGDAPGLGWLGMPTNAVRALLIVNAAVFILQTLVLLAGNLVRGDAAWHSLFDRVFGLSGGGLRSGMVWQLGTYMFLHSTNILHIIFNMLALWMFGREVEEWIGARRFLQLYFTGGLVGALCWLAFNWHGHAPLLGASAAVYAVCIAFATLVPERPITMLLFFIVPVTMKAKWWAWIAVALVAYASVVETGGNIAHLAHLGGVVVGYVFIKWLGWGESSRFVETLQAAARPVTRLLEERQRRKNMPPEEFISTQVDPILDKISREGIHSLTREERRILEQAQAKMKERGQEPPPSSAARR
ncbi:MAG: rhomboid family intramembrane serine protease [Verrucomicrobia bacterium]|nr:rhomboid family intramembrane serine protease [Verrucomicrobiota bacterium]